MKTSLFCLAAGMALHALAGSASAQIFTQLDFEGVPSGSLAQTFATSRLSFHQAKFVSDLDEYGIPAGAPYWQIDGESDALYPLTVEDPLAYGRGPAPSGSNALQALWQPLLIQFDRGYALDSFSVSFDNDPFGMPDEIAFLFGQTQVATLAVDLSTPGLVANAVGIPEITGIVLPAGAFYDDLSLTLVPVPEPSTYAAAGALFLLALGLGRRFRSRKKAEHRA